MVLFQSRRTLQFIFLLAALSFSSYTSACSMYKVTLDGKTMVGSNEDAWRTTPHLWFENGKNGTYGCAFTGSRRISNNRYAAQSGMNEHGVTFSRLTSYHPVKKSSKNQLKLIENPDQFLMDVLHACKSINEVYTYLDQYDRSCFISDVFVYVEPSGEYLVVEPYQLIRGNDPSYVQANFCPSITEEVDRRVQVRYQKGRDLLNRKIDVSLNFCTQVSNEMHVCRDKIGDGTLLTDIWNSSELTFNVFFYHDYSSGLSFDLMEELAKGDHQLDLYPMYPENEEFEQLKSYITPFNTPWLRIALTLLGVFFLISSFYFIVGMFKAAKRNQNRVIHLLLAVIFLLAFGYMFVLTTTREVYYFPAPYKAHSFLKMIASYIPYLIIGLSILLTVLFWKKSNISKWGVFSKGLLYLNAFAMVAVIFGFFYWKLL